MPAPEGQAQGGEGQEAGHRPTLWWVPEVCNLLRHLKINRNLFLEGTSYQRTRAVAGRGAHGESEKAAGSSQEATRMFSAFSGRASDPPCRLADPEETGAGPAEALLLSSADQDERMDRTEGRRGAGLGVRRRLCGLVFYYQDGKNY